MVCTLVSKVETMRALGIDVLVDDKPSTVKEVIASGLIGLQFVPYYMTNYNERDRNIILHLAQTNLVVESLK